MQNSLQIFIAPPFIPIENIHKHVHSRERRVERTFFFSIPKRELLLFSRDVFQQQSNKQHSALLKFSSIHTRGNLAFTKIFTKYSYRVCIPYTNFIPKRKMQRENSYWKSNLNCKKKVLLYSQN